MIFYEFEYLYTDFHKEELAAAELLGRDPIPDIISGQVCLNMMDVVAFNSGVAAENGRKVFFTEVYLSGGGCFMIDLPFQAFSDLFKAIINTEIHQSIQKEKNVT